MSPRLCECDYTTRKYNTDGTVVWSANYFSCILKNGLYGWGGKSVQCQKIDSNHVYVGGPHVANQNEGWSIVAFSQSDGKRVWSRNLKADMAALSYDNGSVQQIQINSDGNLVVMLFRNSANTSQAFVTIGTDGHLISTAIMDLTLPSSYGGLYGGMSSFVVTESGTYHCVNNSRYIFDFNPTIGGRSTVYHLGEIREFGSLQYHIYAEPFLSGIGGYSLPDIISIFRVNGKDYYGFSNDPFGTNGTLILLRGKSSQDVQWQTADFEVRIGFDNALFDALTVFDMSISSSNGDILVASPQKGTVSYGGIACFTASGKFRWQANCGGYSIASDSNGNIYAGGIAFPCVQSFTSSGSFRWGHQNCRSGTSFVCRDIDYCTSDNTVVRSGFAFDSYRASGPQTKKMDQFFVSSTCTGSSPYGEDPDCSSGNCVYGAYPWSALDPTKSGYVWAYSSASGGNPCNTAIGCGCVRDGSGPAFRALYGRPVNSTDTLTIGCCSGTSMDGEVCS